MAKQPLELIHIPDYLQIKHNFLEELTLAFHHKPSSISFLKHELSEKPLLTKGIVQGIVIGGTNYIVATEEVESKTKRKVLKHSTGVLPTFDSKETLIAFFIEHLNPKADAIGINFGFPLEAHTGSQGEIDGKLIRSVKEHTFEGLTESIGTLVKKIYQEKYQKQPKVSIANDTVCLTLAGDGTENGAIVAGTGFNMCLVLKEENKRTLVNLECGNFDKFTLSPVLQKIDAESEKPGEQLLEKSVSGKYLALYFNKKIRESHQHVAPIVTSQELSELSHENHHDVAGDLARAIITRSAYLVASAIAGAYEFCGKPQTFSLIGEGSLLWNGWHYYENVQSQLAALDIPQGTITIKNVKESSINGALGLIIK